MRKNTPEDFWNRVEKRGPDSCWEWTGCKRGDGYGVMMYHGHLRGAHRLAYRFSKGEIPRGMCVCHACDNPLCCNPDHLWVGTHAQNNADRKKKGRSATGDNNGARVHPERLARLKGEMHHTSRLKTKDVQNIIIRYRMGHRQAAIAKDYGITQSHVSNLIRGKRWSHVDRGHIRPS